jgi:8-oxo-dGTP pyrophosphatase MutT (NUDIX family)
LLLPSVGGIIYDVEGRVLLVQQRDNSSWSLPGGVIEPDETPADAIVREAREETGLQVRPDKVLGVFGGPDCVVRYANGDETQYVAIIFECAVTGGGLSLETDETSSARFVARRELDSLDIAPWIRDILRSLYPKPDEAVFAPARQEWTTE